MDFSDLTLTAEPSRLQLIHPVTKKAMDAFVLVVSATHPEHANRVLAAVRKGVKGKAEGLRDAFSENRIDAVASMIVGWEGIEISGKPFVYSEKNAVKLLTDYAWIVDQVDEFSGKVENFIGARSKK